MCCHGCEAVAQAIVESGHADFYRRRTARPGARPEPVPDFIRSRAYDHPAVQSRYVDADSDDDSLKHASLIIHGITCSACAWLIEHRLKQTPGIVDVYVNYSTHRAVLSWRPEQIELGRIIEIIHAIGYKARPFDTAAHEDIARREQRAFLLRIGITGALGMQVMMIATAMYFGEDGSMQADHRQLFRWLSLFLTLPIVAYGALPFFGAALRDIRNGVLGMDVPVTLGLGIAFGGSAWATWTQTGAVYYESVAMFVFLLLCARFLEARARHRSSATIEAMNDSLPDLAERRGPDGQWQPVAASDLAAGDIVRVRPGNGFPADGNIVEGATTANEALLTGESTPIGKPDGAAVLAGSVNIEQPVLVEVSKPHNQSMISQIMMLTERAQAYKPALARLANQVAGWFIAGVLLLAAASGAYWISQDEPQWLAIVVSILVVTCPCALSLATPTALTTAINALTGRSVVPTTGSALESLAAVDTVVLDKTGTLTEGALSVESVETLDEAIPAQHLLIAASLNQSSRHPVAQAIRDHCDAEPLPVTRPVHDTGGISGMIDGNRYYIGNAAYIGRHTRHQPVAGGSRTCAWLATEEALLARIELSDPVRREAPAMLQALRQAGVRTYLCSGDHADAVRNVAQRLGMERWAGDMEPEDKLSTVRGLQDAGHVVAAVGDGTNDAPFLSAADVSLSMAGGTDLARIHADMVLTTDNLLAIPEALDIARRTRTIIRQNITWAVCYNLLALPAAAMGAVPPWLAAIGMSLSSLVVVSNALRLNRRRSRPDDAPQPAFAAAAG